MKIGFPVEEVCATLKTSDGILVEDVMVVIRRRARRVYPASNAVMSVTSFWLADLQRHEQPRLEGELFRSPPLRH